MGATGVLPVSQGSLISDGKDYPTVVSVKVLPSLESTRMKAMKTRRCSGGPTVRVHVLACLVLLVLFGTRGRAQVGSGDPASEAFPIVISLDPHRSIDTGADLTFAVVTAWGTVEHRALAHLKGSRRLGVPVRIAWTLLLDHPVAMLLVVMQHEAYGHGGRAREFGSGAGYRVGFPWTIETLFKGSTRFGGGATFDSTGFSIEDQLRVYVGGVEANARSATLIERELVAGRTAQPLQLLYFIRSRLYASQYVLGHTPDPVGRPARFHAEWSGGGDAANYLGYLNTKYSGETGITPEASSETVRAAYHRLRWQAWLNVVDPGTWLAMWGVAREVAIGDDPVSLPVPEIGGRRVLPILTADWMPDGGVISVETVFGRKRGQPSGPRWFSLVAREGNGPGGHLWSAGAASEMFATWPYIMMGGEGEVWNQPSYGAGAGATLRFVVTQGRLRGVLFDVGLKSAGHWLGRPAEPGAFFRIGYRSSPVR